MSTPRAIFITGAASGIGLETARLFASRGWFIGLFDVNEAGLRALAGEVGDDRCCWRVLDVTRYEDVREAVDFFADRTNGRMDVLFNCAGLLRMGPFQSIPIEEQRRQLEVNVIGVVNATFASFGILRETPDAHVVTMGSASGIYGVPELATYSASKFFVKGFTEALSLELERYGITVTDLMPAYVRTPLVTDQTYPHGTLSTIGVKLDPKWIAELVWKAAHGKKLHWVPTVELKVQSFFTRLVPAAARPVMRWLSRLRPAEEGGER